MKKGWRFHARLMPARPDLVACNRTGSRRIEPVGHDRPRGWAGRRVGPGPSQPAVDVGSLLDGLQGGLPAAQVGQAEGEVVEGLDEAHSSYFPDWLLQPRRRAERAKAVIAEAYPGRGLDAAGGGPGPGHGHPGHLQVTGLRARQEASTRWWRPSAAGLRTRA